MRHFEQITCCIFHTFFVENGIDFGLSDGLVKLVFDDLLDKDIFETTQDTHPWIDYYIICQFA